MAIKVVARVGFSDYEGVEDSKDIRKARAWGKLKEEKRRKGGIVKSCKEAR